MELSRAFKQILCDVSHPTLAWCDQAGSIVETLSGPNIWSLAVERSKELKQSGMRPGDRLRSNPHGKSFIVDLFAAMIGHFVLVPEDPSVPSIVPNTDPKKLYKEDVFLELKTSGSTGVPKLRYYTRRGILQQLQSHAAYFNDPTETERLSVLPWGHAFGLVLDLLLGIYSKSVIYAPATEKLRASRKWMATMLDTYDVQHLALVPRQLELILLDQRLTPRAPKVIFVGGASLSPSISERAFTWLGAGRMVEGYGLTEAGPGVLLDGKAIGCEVKIENGELFVRSSSWTLNESLEASSDWNATEDLCVEQPSGKIDVICRASRRIKSSSGTWVNLASVEEAIARTIGARIVSLKPNQNGLQVILFLDAALSEEKRNWVTDRLRQSTGLESALREIVVDQTTEKLLEQARGKDLSHFFDLQQVA